MRIPRTILVAMVAALAVAGSVIAFVGKEDGAPPALPADPTKSAVTLVEAWPFTVDEPYEHVWRREHPRVSSGMLLVLAVDRDLVHSRQGYEPVLYAGAETAERVNVGETTGYLVVLVPGLTDLTQAPLFFGTPALPEEVDAASAAREVAAAKRSGVRPPDAATVKKALRPGFRVADQYALYLEAANHVEEWSPSETDLISGLRAPRVH